MIVKGKIVLISGGSSGIGAAIIRKLVNGGAKIYSVDKSMPSEPIEGVTYLTADLSNMQEVTEALSIVDELDLLISSAGVMRRGTIFDSTEADFDFLMDNNVKTAWALLKAVGPRLNANATVVQISSGHAIKPVDDPGLYTLAKMATASLAEILAITRPELHVKIVYPGQVLTPLLLTERADEDRERLSQTALRPEDFAEKIINLIESDKKALKFNYNTMNYDLE